MSIIPFLILWTFFPSAGRWGVRFLYLLCPFQLACAPSCLTQADAKAAASYLTECEGYEDTHVCPEGDRIDEEHARDYQECKQ
jgi:hypothetical protein